jgi:hypothetical protein
MRLEVLLAVKMLMALFFVVKQCGLVGGKQNFGIIYQLHLQDEKKRWYSVKNLHGFVMQKTIINTSSY